MVKIAVGLFILCTLLSMVAFVLAELAWLGLVVLILASGALLSGFVFDRLEGKVGPVRSTRQAS
ncbi:MAG TPA: hypothetical protein VNR37_09470 [Microbacteriaceae bacterium]|nr:hypothetical protein [Microbacteriaceae bacterium]